MLRRIGVAISVGLADSLNPSTVGPALYIATGRQRVWRVTQFTIGVFSVTFVGGIVLTIGPGRLLLGLVPHPQGTVRHVIELVAGVVLLIVAVAILLGRRSLARRELPGRGGGGGSAFVTGTFPLHKTQSIRLVVDWRRGRIRRVTLEYVRPHLLRRVLEAARR